MWVFGQFGVSLPHNEAGQLASGPSVGADNLQPGDVVVFANTYRRGLSHVGIYVGDGQFVHAVERSARRHGQQPVGRLLGPALRRREPADRRPARSDKLGQSLS